MMVALRPSESSALTRATWHNITEDGILLMNMKFVYDRHNRIFYIETVQDIVLFSIRYIYELYRKFQRVAFHVFSGWYSEGFGFQPLKHCVPQTIACNVMNQPFSLVFREP
jgi:hypothetical protein